MAFIFIFEFHNYLLQFFSLAFVKSAKYSKVVPQALEKFDEVLLETIDEVLRGSLGDLNTQIIYQYLEKKMCPRQEIPRKLTVFSTELRNLLGCGRGQMLGSAQILEHTIVVILCSKLRLQYNRKSTLVFWEQIKEVKEVYNNGEIGNP